jgi:sugar phosphate isomerase/epimerase
MRFGYHNHDWEFGAFDGVTHYEYLMKHVPVMFAEVDIFWSTFGKADTVKLLRQYHERIPLIHVKDGPLDTRTFSAVGDGKVDIRGILSHCDANIVQYLILEIDAVNGDMVEAVKRSYRFLTGNGLAQGQK